jgi:hypothetical protein
LMEISFWRSLWIPYGQISLLLKSLSREEIYFKGSTFI